MNMFVTHLDALTAPDVSEAALDPDLLLARQSTLAAAVALEQALELDREQAWRDGPEGPSPVAGAADAAGAAVGEQAAFEFGFGVRMDMATTPQGLELSMELPGVQDRDIEIEVRGETLTVRGELRRNGERPGRRTYRMSERAYGPFSRSIDLPKGVRPDQIRASLDRGLLSIFVPNPASPAATMIHIQSALTYLNAVDDVLEFAIAAPGLGEDDLEIEVAGGVMTILGRPEHPICANADLDGGEADEFTIFRAIELPAEVRADEIVATLAKGVLKVTVPNRTNQDRHRIQVRAA
jgi:HSP20 family protein